MGPGWSLGEPPGENVMICWYQPCTSCHVDRHVSVSVWWCQRWYWRWFNRILWSVMSKVFHVQAEVEMKPRWSAGYLQSLSERQVQFNEMIWKQIWKASLDDVFEWAQCFMEENKTLEVDLLKQSAHLRLSSVWSIIRYHSADQVSTLLISRKIVYNLLLNIFSGCWLLNQT